MIGVPRIAAYCARARHLRCAAPPLPTHPRCCCAHTRSSTRACAGLQPAGARAGAPRTPRTHSSLRPRVLSRKFDLPLLPKFRKSPYRQRRAMLVVCLWAMRHAFKVSAGTSNHRRRHRLHLRCRRLRRLRHPERALRTCRSARLRPKFAIFARLRRGASSRRGMTQLSSEEML